LLASPVLRELGQERQVSLLSPSRLARQAPTEVVSQPPEMVN
jgi:hypothetical protein